MKVGDVFKNDATGVEVEITGIREKMVSYVGIGPFEVVGVRDRRDFKRFFRPLDVASWIQINGWLTRHDLFLRDMTVREASRTSMLYHLAITFDYAEALLEDCKREINKIKA